MADVVVGVVVEYTIKPILHQLDYLFHYKENIKEVEKKGETLGTIKDSVQILVRQDKGKGNAIFDGVSKWLDNVKEVLEMAQQNENPSCFNFVERYQLSRKAKKRVENIIELINEGNGFNKDNIGYPVPSPDTNSPALPTDYQIIESRTSMIEEIKEALANPNVNKVGVCGMGGVGKTALLNEVKKLVLEKNLFYRVIQVEVGQSKSVFNIQEEMRDKLNMELNIEYEEVRASRLRTHIAERKENMLFMLDDIWKEHDVEKEFGIPCRSESRIEGCKILMTSRSQHALKNEMNTEKIFEVNSLTKEESWKFFVTIVGESSCVEDGYIQQIAKDVVKECGGLPLALKILGKALKGKRVEIWKDALKSLKNPVAVNISGVSEQLYSCLQFSYDSLEDEAKQVLILCSVFPDDYKIKVKDLQMYAMGMGLLKHINTWEDTGNRVIKLVDDLKSCYLLLDNQSNKGSDDCVQMHDVVHDFSKYVASKIDKMTSLTFGSGQRLEYWQEEGDDIHESYNASYADCTEYCLHLPPKLEFPNLQLLILTNRRSSFIGEGNKIGLPVAFLERMKALRVFAVESMMILEPSSWASINNLQTLCLSDCGVIDIDAISQVLKQLKILKIEKCEIKELGMSMCELTQLKVLHVLQCYGFNPREFHPNIIASMTQVEELKFDGFKLEKLLELDRLTRLFSLELMIQNVDILSVKKAEKLEEFSFSVGNVDVHFIRNERCKTSLGLGINSSIHSIGGVLKILLQKCEVLIVKDSVGFTNLLCNNNIPYGKYNCYHRLKELQIYIDNQNQYLDMPRGIENIIHLDLQVSFPQLMDLIIGGENNLQTLWRNNGLTANSFCKLQYIYISSCNKLRYVFPSRMIVLFPRLRYLATSLGSSCWLRWKSFLKLEDLHLRGSKDDGMVSLPLESLSELLYRIKVLSILNSIELVQVFQNGEDQNVAKLKHLTLRNLPKLTQVWEENTNQSFDSLEYIYVEGCDNLKYLIPSSITFSNLAYVGVTDCNGLVNLFSSIVAKSLINVKRLSISNCTKMRYIVVVPEGEEESEEEIIFNQLNYLELYNLPKLANFYQNWPTFTLENVCLSFSAWRGWT